MNIRASGSGLTGAGDSMRMSTVLVIEDHEPFRRVVCSMLHELKNLQVIGDAADGLEAIQKAERLQPDLVLLDIGLPTLSGIEVAKRMRRVAPKSKILVLTQESSQDVVEEAANVGVLGYVLKCHAQGELLAAIELIQEGKQFFGSGLKGTRSLRGREVSSVHCHEVVFYSDDAVFVESCAGFSVDALKAGKAVVVVATKSHREGLVKKWKADRIEEEINAAARRGAYIVLDSIETLSTMTTMGAPDRGKLFGSVGRILDSAAHPQNGERLPVAVFGECAPLLWAEGKQEAAIQVEQLWDELAGTYAMDLRCAYPLSAFQSREKHSGIRSICAEHSAIHLQ